MYSVTTEKASSRYIGFSRRQHATKQSIHAVTEIAERQKYSGSAFSNNLLQSLQTIGNLRSEFSNVCILHLAADVGCLGNLQIGYGADSKPQRTVGPKCAEVITTTKEACNLQKFLEYIWAPRFLKKPSRTEPQEQYTKTQRAKNTRIQRTSL